jgi:transposase-like protein
MYQTMENSNVSSYVKRSQKDYSLAFKLQVVNEVEKGLLNQDQAQRKYGIQGNSTILIWLRKHGSLDWSPKKKMGKPTPNKQIRELEKRIQRLEAEKEILNRAIDIADDMLSTDIRKKYLPLSQKASESQQGEEDTPSA